jgi:hypothetical protein
VIGYLALILVMLVEHLLYTLTADAEDPRDAGFRLPAGGDLGAHQRPELLPSGSNVSLGASKPFCRLGDAG